MAISLIPSHNSFDKKTLNQRTTPVQSASANIDAKIKHLNDWRGVTLDRLRQLIHEADPAIEEEWKWAKATNPGTPVFSHDGIVCTGETYKQVVKLTFARGASLEDPAKLFNSSLEGNVRRAIDIHEGEKIDEAAFKQLIRTAVAANSAVLAQRAKKKYAKLLLPCNHPRLRILNLSAPEACVHRPRLIFQIRTRNFRSPLSTCEDNAARQIECGIRIIVARKSQQLFFSQRVDHTANAGPIDCACTHRARLRARKQSAASQLRARTQFRSRCACQ
jgi:hypothetical protein